MSVSNTNTINYYSVVTPIYLLGASKDKGYLIQGLLAADTYRREGLTTIGAIATSVSNSFLVAKRAFCHVFPMYAPQLKSMDFYFDCDHPQFQVGQDRSASLAFVLGLLNILRHIKDLPQYFSYATTGIVALDGAILNVTNLEEKKNAAFTKSFISHFISPENYKHIDELINEDLSLNLLL